MAERMEHMAGIVKIKADGRVWNCYLGKFEDECTAEQVEIADKIISIDEDMIAAHEISDEDERLERLNDLKGRKMALEAMIEGV